MQVPLETQHRLLDLQRIDLELTQVRRRLRAPAAQAEVSRLRGEVAAAKRALVDAMTESEDLARLIARSEEELERVRERQRRDRAAAAAGASARVQQELDHDLTSLTRRLGDLEDAELEMMEQQEQLEAGTGELRSRSEQLTAELADAEQVLAAETAELRRQERELQDERPRVLADLPERLVALYGTSQNQAGMAAAQLLGSQCQGCRLELPPSEVARLAGVPPEEIESCEECGCILVRG